MFHLLSTIKADRGFSTAEMKRYNGNILTEKGFVE
jgi:hypothetical protein